MKFQCWQNSDTTTFLPSDRIQEHRERGLLESDATFQYEIEAETWQEAMQKHYDAQGWGVYYPPSED